MDAARGPGGGRAGPATVTRMSTSEPRTRRRGAALERAIHGAVLELVAEHGPAGVTMDAVAARAGTGKPVLYRRWANSTELVRDALLAVATQAVPVADTGSYREDMVAVLGGWSTALTGPRAGVVRAIVATMQRDDELARAFREGVIGWRKEEMARLLARGVARGEVRPDAPLDLLRELGAGMLWHRFLITGDPVDEQVVARIVDEILVPLVAPREP